MGQDQQKPQAIFSFGSSGLLKRISCHKKKTQKGEGRQAGALCVWDNTGRGIVIEASWGLVLTVCENRSQTK